MSAGSKKLNSWWFQIYDVTDDDIEQVLDTLGTNVVETTKGIEHRNPNKDAGIDYAIASVYKTLVDGETFSNMMVSRNTLSKNKYSTLL